MGQNRTAAHDKNYKSALPMCKFYMAAEHLQAHPGVVAHPLTGACKACNHTGDEAARLMPYALPYRAIVLLRKLSGEKTPVM